MKVYLFIHTKNWGVGIIIGDICGRLTEKNLQGREVEKEKRIIIYSLVSVSEKSGHQ